MISMLRFSVMMQLIAYDGVNSPDALVGFAASAAIAVSDIPFNGPMSEVRVGRVDGEFVINPTLEEMAASDIDCMIAGTIDNIVMVEGEMQEIQEARHGGDHQEVAHESIKLTMSIPIGYGCRNTRDFSKKRLTLTKITTMRFVRR